MDMSSLSKNIGRLCMDKYDTLYMIVDVEYDERSVPMYRVYYIEKDTTLSLYVSVFDNPNLVRWLTP
jgi:hypothetical protein